MHAIILIGLSLFLCSAGAIYVTLRASSISDLKRKPLRKKGWLSFGRRKRKADSDISDTIALADRRKLDDHARSLEGAVFFFSKIERP
jgi:hypothetical protein